MRHVDQLNSHADCAKRQLNGEPYGVFDNQAGRNARSCLAAPTLPRIRFALRVAGVANALVDPCCAGAAGGVQFGGGVAGWVGEVGRASDWLQFAKLG